MYKVFIDGREGTTGLRIYERLAEREDLSLIVLDEDKRKILPLARPRLTRRILPFSACRTRRHGKQSQ